MLSLKYLPESSKELVFFLFFAFRVSCDGMSLLEL